jgi:hypothetical protein
VVLLDSSDDETALPDQPTGGDADASSSRDLEEEELKGICPRGNNKVVIRLFRVHNRCLFFMLELY